MKLTTLLLDFAMNNLNVAVLQKIGPILGAILGGAGITVGGMWLVLDDALVTEKEFALLSDQVIENRDMIRQGQSEVEEVQDSIDDVHLAVLDSSILDIEERIRNLEAKPTLTVEEQFSLAELRRRLQDLEDQRDRLYTEQMQR